MIWIEALVRNVRHAVRGLRRTPGFTITVVLTLALGIGANSAVFSAIDAVLVRALPFPDPDRLVSLEEVRQRTGATDIAPVRLEDWNELNTSFEAITGYYTEDASDTTGEVPERVRQANVAPRFLDVWGIAPALGRGFNAADHEVGAAPIVLISHGYWQRRFDADPLVLGETVRISDRPYSVVGVMPPSFRYPDRGVDFWVPTIFASWMTNRNLVWYIGFGRLRPGVTLEQARADLAVVQSQLAEQHPEPDREISAQLEPFKETTVGAVRGSLWLLFGAVSVLLLIACTNIAALLLSRASQRREETAVRVALGASGWSVAGQRLTEAAVLALVGAVVGLAVASGISTSFRVLAPGFPRIEEIALDGRILLYTFSSVVVVAVLCGLLPAIHSARAAPGRTVAEGGRAQVAPRQSLQWLFVGVQIALSVMLLAGAGLLVRSFQELWRVDPGFEPSGVLTFRISGSYGEDYDNLARRTQLLLGELSAVPDIDVAATSSPVPGVLDDGTGFQFGADEYELVEGGVDTQLAMVGQLRIVSPSYFESMRIPMLAGEPCRIRPEGDTPEVVVNSTFVDRFLSGLSPVGLHLRATSVSRIVGVARDAREYGLDRDPVPVVYRCSTTFASPALTFLVRTRGEPTAIAGVVRAKINELEPLRSVYDIAPLTERMGDEYAENRLRAILLASFAATALALACLGVYGTLSYVVNLRRREVGLRVALGALSGNIVRQFLLKVLRVVGVACLVGLALSFAFARALSGMLYGVSPSDPITLSGVIVLVTAVAALAALLPAIRAARVDPMRVLREE